MLPAGTLQSAKNPLGFAVMDYGECRLSRLRHSREGVSSDLVGRVWQHRTHAVAGFTDRYGITRLVWYELHLTMESAILREKRIKKWNRSWKVELINKTNPSWRDLWGDIAGG
jgi:putative endonuclease